MSGSWACVYIWGRESEVSQSALAGATGMQICSVQLACRKRRNLKLGAPICGKRRHHTLYRALSSGRLSSLHQRVHRTARQPASQPPSHRLLCNYRSIAFEFIANTIRTPTRTESDAARGLSPGPAHARTRSRRQFRLREPESESEAAAASRGLALLSRARRRSAYVCLCLRRPHFIRERPCVSSPTPTVEYKFNARRAGSTRGGSIRAAPRTLCEL
ncbi:hypothetical protein DFH11DRAFT_1262125 [Phellopilus nigrolimitatus]|nr:hypothetical protein DFH11DRAFT_1262125 [Phellopilus nigrolimitatus]